MIPMKPRLDIHVIHPRIQGMANHIPSQLETQFPVHLLEPSQDLEEPPYDIGGRPQPQERFRAFEREIESWNPGIVECSM